MLKSKLVAGLLGAAFVAAAGSVSAAPVNGTGDVTPDVIFGDGNANGSFTGTSNGGVEVGLRAKVRYNSSGPPGGGSPENKFNYDGDRTYTFNPNNFNAPANRAGWNFEFAVNTDTSDASDTPAMTVGDFTYLLEIDQDPGAGVDFQSFDPFNVPFADHAFGFNSTGNGDGEEAADGTEYLDFLTTFNVVQQSWNYGFGFLAPALVDPQSSGIFTINLSISDGGGLLTSTSIDVVVLPVPLPAALPLFAAGLGAFGFVGWRRKRRAAVAA